MSWSISLALFSLHGSDSHKSDGHRKPKANMKRHQKKKRSSVQGNCASDVPHHFVLAVNWKSHLLLIFAFLHWWLPGKWYHSNQIAKSWKCFQRPFKHQGQILIGSRGITISVLSMRSMGRTGWDGTSSLRCWKEKYIGFRKLQLRHCIQPDMQYLSPNVNSVCPWGEGWDGMGRDGTSWLRCDIIVHWPQEIAVEILYSASHAVLISAQMSFQPCPLGVDRTGHLAWDAIFFVPWPHGIAVETLYSVSHALPQPKCPFCIVHRGEEGQDGTGWDGTSWLGWL